MGNIIRITPFLHVEEREFMVLAPDGDLVVFGESIFEMPLKEFGG